MPTFGDVFRAYVKPSLGGELVIRKRNTIRRSENVRKVNENFATAKLASQANGKCKQDNKTVKQIRYVGGKRVEADVCPIQYFRSYLRQAGKNANLKVIT